MGKELRGWGEKYISMKFDSHDSLSVVVPKAQVCLGNFAKFYLQTCGSRRPHKKFMWAISLLGEMDGGPEAGFRGFHQALGERGVRVDGVGEVQDFGAHFNSERGLVDQVGCSGSNDMTSQEPLAPFIKNHFYLPGNFPHGLGLAQGADRER